MTYYGGMVLSALWPGMMPAWEKPGWAWNSSPLENSNQEEAKP